MTFRRRVLLLLLAAPPLLASAQPGPDIVRLDDPAEAFARVERFVLYAQHIAIDQVQVRADSAFRAELVGRWRLGPDNSADVLAAGIFHDFSLDSRPRLASDGNRMVGGRSEEVGFDTTAAPYLRDALAIGFMRMGLFHNLVRLHTGSPPDHAQGGVTDWVTVHAFTWLPEARVRDRMARPMRFTVRVAGEDSAEATLYLDTATGLPLRRTQTVGFGSRRMVVHEEYAGWTDQPLLDGAAFQTSPDGVSPDDAEAPEAETVDPEAGENGRGT